MASKSLIQIAYENIRERILSGEFMPGSFLSENSLSEALHMSRTPIRSAISQLETEGFVHSVRNRGILVKELSMKEMLDIFEVIHAFQHLTLNYLRENEELPDMRALQARLDSQLEATSRGDYASYVEHSLLFSRELTAIMNNQVMLQMMDTIRAKIVMYASINYKTTPHEPHYSANALNQAVYELLKAKDYEAVQRMINEAYERNRKRILRIGTLG